MVMFQERGPCPYRYGVCKADQKDKERCEEKPGGCLRYWQIKKKLEAAKEWEKKEIWTARGSCPIRNMCAKYMRGFTTEKEAQERCEGDGLYIRCVAYWSCKDSQYDEGKKR